MCPPPAALPAVPASQPSRIKRQLLRPRCAAFSLPSPTPAFGGGTARCSCATDPHPPEILQTCSPEPPVIPTTPEPGTSPGIPSPDPCSSGAGGGDKGWLHGTTPRWHLDAASGLSRACPGTIFPPEQEEGDGRRRGRVGARWPRGHPTAPAGSTPGPAWATPGVLPISLPARQAAPGRSRCYTGLGTSFPPASGCAGTLGDAGCLAPGVSSGSGGLRAPGSPTRSQGDGGTGSHSAGGWVEM